MKRPHEELSDLQLLAIESVISRARMVDVFRLRDLCEQRIRLFKVKQHEELVAFVQALVPSVWDVRIFTRHPKGDRFVEYSWRNEMGAWSASVHSERWRLVRLGDTGPAATGDVTRDIHNQVVAFIEKQESSGGLAE